jgi:hypothetical protein
MIKYGGVNYTHKIRPEFEWNGIIFQKTTVPKKVRFMELFKKQDFILILL